MSRIFISSSSSVSAGAGRDSGSAGSVTKSGVSGIAGNKDVRTGDAETGIAKIFDKDKVQKEVNAQMQITQAFGPQASAVVDNYAQGQMKTLRSQYTAATTPEEKEAIQAKVDELRMETEVINVLIGAVTGFGNVALAQETLAAASEEMRKITIADSKIAKGITDKGITDEGITDGKTILTNTSGESVGGKWDLVPTKTAGTRFDPDGVCGAANERCLKQKDANGDFIRDEKGIPKLAYNAEGMAQFDSTPSGADMSLAAFLETDAGKKMAGTTGGIQGREGTFKDNPYPPGGLTDKLFEAFGGEHDHIGGKITGLYDDQGNIKRGMSGAEAKAYDAWAAVAIVPSAPFAMATFLPPEVWKAISVLLEAAK